MRNNAKSAAKFANRLSTLKTAAENAPPPQSKSEARGAERRDAYKFGRIFTSKNEEIQCIIRDMSLSGARVVLQGAFTLPTQVTLRIDQTGARQKCRVAWQRDNEAGLSF